MTNIRTLTFDLYIKGNHARDLISDENEIENFNEFLDNGFFYKVNSPQINDMVFFFNGDFYKWSNKMDLILLISSSSFKNSKKLIEKESTNKNYSNEMSLCLGILIFILLIVFPNKFTFFTSLILFFFQYKIRN